jgi:hypothetical protein
MSRILITSRDEAIAELRRRGRFMPDEEREALLSFIANRIDANELADMLLPVIEDESAEDCEKELEESEDSAQHSAPD